jgi:hypothetical protein
LWLIKEQTIPKFRALAKEVIYYEAIVEAASKYEAKQFAANNDELFVENDSSGIKISEAEIL